jgi:RNA polymerase sigma-70 factor (ECF subfamily)
MKNIQRRVKLDEDVKLMLELKTGDRSAFDRLVNKYTGPILNFVFRFTGSREDAQDIAQEVFLRVFKAAPGYVPSAKFTTWLYRIAANAGVDYIRKKKKDLAAGSSLDEEIAGEEGGHRIQAADERTEDSQAFAEAKEMELNVNAALQALPENQRSAIILRIYEEKSYDEIAKILGLSIPAVESLLFRARQELKNRLAKTDKSL